MEEREANDNEVLDSVHASKSRCLVVFAARVIVSLRDAAPSRPTSFRRPVTKAIDAINAARSPAVFVVSLHFRLRRYNAVADSEVLTL